VLFGYSFPEHKGNKTLVFFLFFEERLLSAGEDLFFFLCLLRHRGPSDPPALEASTPFPFPPRSVFSVCSPVPGVAKLSPLYPSAATPNLHQLFVPLYLFTSGAVFLRECKLS